MHAAVENYLPATMNTGAYFTLRYADGGRERISPSALDVSPEPDAYTLHLAVRRPTPTTMHVDPATASTNCGICAAELAHAPTLCYLCATPSHTPCISPSTPGPATPSPPTDGYDWFCFVCVEARGLDGSLFRSPVPLTHAHDTHVRSQTGRQQLGSPLGVYLLTPGQGHARGVATNVRGSGLALRKR